MVITIKKYILLSINRIATLTIGKMTFLDTWSAFLEKHTPSKILLLLVILFLIRFAFGLFGDFWFEDQVQIFLIGLKFFTTHSWPYFGPDLVYTHTQLPGALQSLLVAIPLFILPIPESPLFFLAILSFSGLALISWYTTKRLPDAPKWLVWGIFSLNAWGLQFSTNIVNPSYLMITSCLFLFAFLESLDRFSLRLIQKKYTFIIMGFCLGWTMQLHASWTILVVAIALSLLLSIKNIVKFSLYSLLGFISIAWLIIPTLYKYGIDRTFAYLSTNTGISLKTDHFLPVLSKLIAFGIFELPSHIHHKYDEFLGFAPYLAPFFILMLVVYVLQFITLVVFLFLPHKKFKGLSDMRYLILGIYLVLCVSYLFTPLNPRSHMFYLTYPIVNMYGIYIWSQLSKDILMKRFMLICLISMVFVNIHFMMYRFNSVSLYTNRKKVMEAIQTKDYTKIDQRRATIWGCCY